MRVIQILYFVGTNDMLVGLHVPTKLRKSIGGGGGGRDIMYFRVWGMYG